MAGGGTGGHVVPALAVSAKLKQRGATILFVGSKRAEERRLVEQAGYDFKVISAGKLRRYWSLHNFIDPFKLVRGYLQSRKILKEFAPDVVFAKGGYMAYPVMKAASRLGIPVVAHESDVVPGLANRLGARYAAAIAVSLPTDRVKGLPAEKLVYTGNPIRTELIQGKPDRAYEDFGLDANVPTALVQGGSQGSRVINELIWKALPLILDDAQVVHQVGEDAEQEAAAHKADLTTQQQRRYQPVAYLELRPHADLYAAADLVVSRSGAGALAEIAGVGKASILIPHQRGGSGHQAENAKVFAETGAAIVLDEATLIAEELARQVKALLHNPQRLAEMGRSARTLARLDAAEKVADLVWSHGLAKGNQ